MLLTRLKKGGASSPTLYNKLEMEVSNMIPKFRAWYTPFGGSVKQFNKMKYGSAGSLLTHAEMSPDDYKIMQSTGLKDKNGVEIFESDILIYTAKSVNYSDTYWHSYCEVFRAPNGAYRIRGEHIYETDLYSNRNHVTVAGNIYDTPELLKKERLMTSTADPELLEDKNEKENQ